MILYLRRSLSLSFLSCERRLPRNIDIYPDEDERLSSPVGSIRKSEQSYFFSYFHSFRQDSTGKLSPIPKYRAHIIDGAFSRYPSPSGSFVQLDTGDMALNETTSHPLPCLRRRLKMSFLRWCPLSPE